MQRVLIYTPTADRRVFADYALALAHTAVFLDKQKIEVQLAIHPNAFLVFSRNAALAALAHGNHTDLLFIDGDIGWKPGDALRLLSHDAPVVAGTYRLKTDDRLEFAAHPWPAPTNDAGLCDVEKVGAGFFRIRKDAAKLMFEAYPNLVYRHGSATHVGAFNPVCENGELVGEDHSFCRRWRNIGGKVLVDPAIKLDHWGVKNFGH
jgi:hypothetical protein